MRRYDQRWHLAPVITLKSSFCSPSIHQGYTKVIFHNKDDMLGAMIQAVQIGGPDGRRDKDTVTVASDGGPDRAGAKDPARQAGGHDGCTAMAATAVFSFWIRSFQLPICLATFYSCKNIIM
jgi:hypothetical protein